MDVVVILLITVSPSWGSDDTSGAQVFLNTFQYMTYRVLCPFPAANGSLLHNSIGVCLKLLTYDGLNIYS